MPEHTKPHAAFECLATEEQKNSFLNLPTEVAAVRYDVRGLQQSFNLLAPQIVENNKQIAEALQEVAYLRGKTDRNGNGNGNKSAISSDEQPVTRADMKWLIGLVVTIGIFVVGLLIKQFTS
jgi:hypothetical protein